MDLRMFRLLRGRPSASRHRPASGTPTRYFFSVGRSAPTLPPKPEPITTTS